MYVIHTQRRTQTTLAKHKMMFTTDAQTASSTSPAIVTRRAPDAVDGVTTFVPIADATVQRVCSRRAFTPVQHQRHNRHAVPPRAPSCSQDTQNVCADVTRAAQAIAVGSAVRELMRSRRESDRS
jgi:hypothetical protein